MKGNPLGPRLPGWTCKPCPMFLACSCMLAMAWNFGIKLPINGIAFGTAFGSRQTQSRRSSLHGTKGHTRGQRHGTLTQTTQTAHSVNGQTAFFVDIDLDHVFADGCADCLNCSWGDRGAPLATCLFLTGSWSLWENTKEYMVASMSWLNFFQGLESQEILPPPRSNLLVMDACSAPIHSFGHWRPGLSWASL